MATGIQFNRIQPDSAQRGALVDRLCDLIRLEIGYKQSPEYQTWLEYLVHDIPEIIRKARAEARQELRLNPEAVPPTNKIKLLCEYVPKFAATWQRRRTDLLDQSQSSYDMSIAYWCAAAGFSRQETVDTIIAHARIHGQRLDKVTIRQDYVERTLARAGL